MKEMKENEKFAFAKRVGILSVLCVPFPFYFPRSGVDVVYTHTHEGTGERSSALRWNNDGSNKISTLIKFRELFLLRFTNDSCW
jgi:hypothetical protein